MSAQINLYHPRYLKQRELLALGPVAAMAAGVYLLLAVAAVLVSRDAAQRQAQATAIQAKLAAVTTEVEVATQAAAARRPNAKLQAEVDGADALLRRREHILHLLEGGAIGTTTGFAEHFRALARQTPEGLWLTGFAVDAGGADIRISGKTLHAAAVPEYIGRLGREAAFQGKSFAAMTMQRPAEPAAPRAASTTGAATGAAGAVPPAPTLAATPAALRPIDFVLLPKASVTTSNAPATPATAGTAATGTEGRR